MDIDERPEPTRAKCLCCGRDYHVDDIRTCEFCNKEICRFCDTWNCENPECTLNGYVCNNCRADDYCDKECHAEHLNAQKSTLEIELVEVHDKATKEADRISGDIDDINSEMTKLIGDQND
ncbi:MAG TPA: hypothetical protein ENH82_13550 [bacterium]|nr:hypothetical protein [bacterium]